MNIKDEFRNQILTDSLVKIRCDDPSECNQMMGFVNWEVCVPLLYPERWWDKSKEYQSVNVRETVEDISFARFVRELVEVVKKHPEGKITYAGAGDDPRAENAFMFGAVYEYTELR